MVTAVAAGVVLMVVAFVDALATTLSVGAGAGPLTRRFTGVLGRGLLRLHQRDSEGSLLRFGGAGLLIVTVLVWVLLLWGGWTLVFVSSGGAVVDSGTRAPAGPLDVVYFVGFTVFTLGVGDFVASTPAWRVMTALASFTGLFLITLSITYLLSVVGAVVARRSLAVRIHALGPSAGGIVARGWTGGTFSSAFIQQLVALTGELSTVAEQHLAYPVLHYFHTGEASTSASRAIAQLDGAMLLMRAGVAPQARPDASAVVPVREAIKRYVTTAATTSAMVPLPGVPALPALTPLLQVGVPVAGADDVARTAGKEDDDRRRGLHRLVNNDGWSWPEGA